MKQYSKPTIKEIQIALNQTLLNTSIDVSDKGANPLNPILNPGFRGTWGAPWTFEEE